MNPIHFILQNLIKIHYCGINILLKSSHVKSTKTLMYTLSDLIASLDFSNISTYKEHSIEHCIVQLDTTFKNLNFW